MVTGYTLNATSSTPPVIDKPTSKDEMHCHGNCGRSGGGWGGCFACRCGSRCSSVWAQPPHQRPQLHLIVLYPSLEALPA